MIDYTLTESGASWIASRMSGTAANLDLIYVVYSNDSSEHTSIDAKTSAEDFYNLNGNTWFMRVTNNVTVTSKPAQDGKYTVAVSGVVDRSDIMPKDNSPELMAGQSKIITIAVGYTGKGGTQDHDVIVAACNVDPVSWVDNMAIAVSCPITVVPYPVEDN